MDIEVAIAQLKPRKADYAANLAQVGDMFAQLAPENPPVDLLILPEAALSGYFLEGGVRELARSAEQVFSDVLQVYRERVSRPGSALDIAVGFYEVWRGQYYNSALYATLTGLDDATVTPGIIHVHRKFFLPTYGVFDEKRFVARGRRFAAFDTRIGRVAILICEDAWHSISATLAALQGAHVIIVLSASPGREFGGRTIGNLERWEVLLKGMAEEHGVFVVYGGLVGFEGGKGFTGSSRVVDPWGRTVVIGDLLEPCLVRASVSLGDVSIARAETPLLADLEATLGDIAEHFDVQARHPIHREATAPDAPRGSMSGMPEVRIDW